MGINPKLIDKKPRKFCETEGNTQRLIEKKSLNPYKIGRKKIEDLSSRF